MHRVTDNELVWTYFNAELGIHRSVDFRGALYVPDSLQHLPPDFAHVGVAVGYNSFVGRTCCMHTVIKRPEMVVRPIVRDTFHYPFIVCGVEAVLALVDSTNQPALDFDTRLGFKEIARIPNGGTDGDLVVLQMLRSECRWLRAH